MSIQEGVATRIGYKFYASGAIASNSEPSTASEPGASGAQLIRRVSSSVTLGKDSYQSQEVRSDRQIQDMRHGVRRVQGAIDGELSPLTWQDFMEAVMRGDWAASLVLDESDFTDVVADNGTAKLTMTAGDPVTAGLRVGDMIRLANMSVAANNRDFRILGFGGTSNREITVDPAPADNVSDSAFTLTRLPKLINPSSSLVKRKLAIEHYYEDVDVTELFTECRLGGMRVGLPPTGISTIGFDVLGRNQVVLATGASPYFTSPTAETTTGLTAAVNGRLMLGGSVVGVVTGLDFAVNLNPTADPVVGQNFVPDIFLGRFNLTGNITAFLESELILEYFNEETELALAILLTTGNEASAPFLSFYMPRIKLGGASVQNSGEGGVTIQAPFQALKKAAATGHDGCTLVISDSAAVVS